MYGHPTNDRECRHAVARNGDRAIPSARSSALRQNSRASRGRVVWCARDQEEADAGRKAISTNGRPRRWSRRVAGVALVDPFRRGTRRSGGRLSDG